MRKEVRKRALAQTKPRHKPGFCRQRGWQSGGAGNRTRVSVYFSVGIYVCS